LSEAADLVLLYTLLKPKSVAASNFLQVSEDSEKIKVKSVE